MTPCRCGTREYPSFEPGCRQHGDLAFALGTACDGNHFVSPIPARLPSYDEHQAAAELVTCPCCANAFYMTQPKPVCAACAAKP